MESVLIQDLKSYSVKKFWMDLIAGITVAIVLIPQGMAYAMLAGLDPVYGLYAGLVPMIVYPFFASSRLLSVGPVALMSIIVLAGVSIFATPGSEEYVQIVLLTAFISGCIQVLFSVLKFGQLSNFLSRPVISGFISAAGVIIIFSQIKYLLSINLPRSVSVPEIIQLTVSHFNELNTYSLLLGLLAIVLILGLRKINKHIPGAIIAVIIGIILMKFFHLNEFEVPFLGELPVGFPAFNISFLKLEHLFDLLPAAFIVSFICFVGSIAIAKNIEGNGKVQSVQPDKELMGLGVAKIIGSFFLAMPTTGSFTRSVVNEQAGAKTGLSSVISGLIIAVVLMYLSNIFYYLPEPILAAIVISSVISLIKISEAKELFKIDRRDFWIMLATFFLTLSLGIVYGILIGIVLSLISFVQRAAKPHFAILGRLPNTNSFRNIKRFPNVEQPEDSLIIRYDQDLFFGNSMHFYETMIEQINSVNNLKLLVLRATSFHNLDSSSLEKIKLLTDYCEDRNIRFVMTDLNGEIRDLFHKAGIDKYIGLDNFYLRVADVFNQSDKKMSNKYSQQINKKKRSKRSFFFRD